jgi:hypothetical protein
MEILLIFPQKFSRISEIYTRKEIQKIPNFWMKNIFGEKINIVAAHFQAQENMPKWASMPKANSASH